MIVTQPAPRLCAASVSVRDVDGAQAGVDGAVHVGQRQRRIAEHQQEFGAASPMPVSGRQRRGVVEPDIAEHDDDGRDDQRQQRDELDRPGRSCGSFSRTQ